MASTTGISPYNGEILDNDNNNNNNTAHKSNKSTMENDNHEGSDDLGQAKSGKPPRNIMAMRHSVSQALLPDTHKLVSRSQSQGYIVFWDVGFLSFSFSVLEFFLFAWDADLLANVS